MTRSVLGKGRRCMVPSLNRVVLTRLKTMQATVASYDDSTRTGHLLTDDGVRLDYPAASLADHIRHLRLGQRVFVETTDTTVTSVRIWR
jgi:hypothetical protein